MDWKLIKVQQTDWIQDNSGYYTLINWIDDNTVRLDVMDRDDMPVVSFQGTASDVRKQSVRWLERQACEDSGWLHHQVLSAEHAAYIGAELARCELLKKDYVQD